MTAASDRGQQLPVQWNACAVLCLKLHAQVLMMTKKILKMTTSHNHIHCLISLWPTGQTGTLQRSWLARQRDIVAAASAPSPLQCTEPAASGRRLLDLLKRRSHADIEFPAVHLHSLLDGLVAAGLLHILDQAAVSIYAPQESRALRVCPTQAAVLTILAQAPKRGTTFSAVSSQMSPMSPMSPLCTVRRLPSCSFCCSGKDSASSQAQFTTPPSARKAVLVDLPGRARPCRPLASRRHPPFGPPWPGQGCQLLPSRRGSSAPATECYHH